MVSEKALYWVAVGVLAIGVSNSFINRHLDWAQCVADRSEMLVGQLSGEATRLVAAADLIVGRSNLMSERTSLAVARAQVLAQAAVARRQAELLRLQQLRTRDVLMRENRLMLLCPQRNPGQDRDEAEAPDSSE